VAGGATGRRDTHFFTGAQAHSPGRLSILRSVAAQSLRLVDWSLSPVLGTPQPCRSGPRGQPTLMLRLACR